MALEYVEWLWNIQNIKKNLCHLKEPKVLPTMLCKNTK